MCGRQPDVYEYLYGYGRLTGFGTLDDPWRQSGYIHIHDNGQCGIQYAWHLCDQPGSLQIGQCKRGLYQIDPREAQTCGECKFAEHLFGQHGEPDGQRGNIVCLDRRAGSQRNRYHTAVNLNDKLYGNGHDSGLHRYGNRHGNGKIKSIGER
jgi:hypothetical protein